MELFREYTLPALVEQSVALLRTNEPADSQYYGLFSGGKDSVVIKELARMAGVRVRWHYNQTTIDPPEVVRFIHEHHPDVEWHKPRHGNFFARMEKKGFPTRRCRWCCEEYKEQNSPVGSALLMGVRAEESPRRAAAWKPVTFHTSTRTWAVAPILTWKTHDVWAFIHERSLPYCSLYNEGFDRLGCIGCPMASGAEREREFARWPKFRALWMRSFERIWQKRSGTTQRDGRPWFGDAYFRDWREMWAWWIGGHSLPSKLDDGDDEVCQLSLDMHSGGDADDGRMP